ncbi:nucleotidyltransferase [Salinicoccus hispanicus]|uniref:tRNA(Met) cytidine acetate ligase n=1 Tax=Salinicoccus hispanicus TaxID=157225 RepID=A0A6N8TV56_9STAP|nr:nucleotidyltransferase [Salinicoccus hispanicus]MXQ49788.1 nucleotidyltransferase [Salinicoccus hispanicus]
MIITSLITEYNPFHNGHIHHIEASRRLTGADVVIAIMSGNFTQRGEIAVADKFTRAQTAIKHVDLVVELPMPWAISFADDFARGGVHVADLLGSDHIVFGSESGDIDALHHTYRKLKDQNIKEKMEQSMKQGYSYPRAINQAIGSDIFTGANNTLGLSYLRAIDSLGSKITPLTIPRLGNQYSETTLSESRFSSATSLRLAIQEGRIEEASRYMPEELARLIHANGPMNNEVLFDTLKLLIQRSTPQSLREIYMMTEGIEYRLLAKIRKHHSYGDFLADVKTKRYTMTRLNRLMIYILLNITKSQMAAIQMTDAVRVLAMNRTGQAFLKTLPEDLEVITNVNSKNSELVQNDIMATDIHNIYSGSDRNDFNTPVIIAD